jgi:hypothetical protein
MTTVQQIYRSPAEDESQSNEDRVRPFARDYCRSLERTITQKLAFINRIKKLDYNTSEFDDGCLRELAQVENRWFDPVIPSEIISFGDACQGFKELFI